MTTNLYVVQNVTEASLFDSYFSFVEDTEPPLIFHRWSLIAAVGAMLGRQYWLPFGQFRIFPNQYIMLIGDPGTRKSTAIKIASNILSAAGYDTFAAERTSKEKFLIDLEGVETDEGVPKSSDSVLKTLFNSIGGDPREVFIAADEFNDFVGAGNMEFLSLLGTLWDWDKPEKPYSQRLKHSRSVSIYQPTVSILGGNTHAGFSAAFPPQAIGQGFLSRLLLIYSEESGKKITFPTVPSEDRKLRLSRQLEKIRSSVTGEATYSARAKEMLDVIYRTFSPLSDMRFRHYSTRRLTHLLKLCLVLSAMRCSTVIEAEDVLFASSILSYAEHRMPSALGEFGKARNADIASKITALLSTTRRPLDSTEIWRQVSSDLEKPEDLTKILQGLSTASRIQWIERTETGARGYILCKPRLDTSKVFTDFTLLPEATNEIFSLEERKR